MRRLPRLLIAALAAVAGLFAIIIAVNGVVGGSGGAVASAATPAQQIGMRVLVVTDSNDSSTASGIAYDDWVNTLQREGVPYDSIVTRDASPGSVPLPALSSTLSDGTQVANYEGVVVATSGMVGLTTAQWTTLQTFEQTFSVRQVTAYAVPSSDYGLGAPSPAGGEPLSGTTALTLTADGHNVFPYLNTASLDTGTWGYEGTPLSGANVDTLISGPAGSSLLGIYTSSDGRQTMYQTFNENQYMLQSQLLRHGELAWLGRNTYFGDQRNYLETNIDDNFLSDDSWSVAGSATTPAHSTDFNPADALREVPADVQQAATWSRDEGLRMDMLFNGGGSVAVADGDSLVGAGDGGSGGTGSTGTTGGSGTGTDPLLAAFTSTDPATGKPYTADFGWISHTWDHPNIDEGCATQDYIEAELNQNTAWGTKAVGTTAGDPINGGLGLASSTDPTAALGNDNPQVVITGEHSGLANLLPGNPGQVDPPSLENAAVGTTAGAFGGTTTGDQPAGEYVYAVSDQFNTAAPGATPVPGTGESEASLSSPITVAAGQSVDLTWGAVCHAADYLVYRAPYTAPIAPATTGTIGAWSQIGTVTSNTTTDFTNPTGNSTTNTSGGGAIEKTFNDPGSSAGTLTGSSGEPTAATKPAAAGTAVESAYEQNPVLDTAFAATTGGGIKYFGADASKPYPTPADASFTTGAYGGAEVPSGGTFQDAGGTGIPRYPTNIYYNVSTNAQEVDEYETLYDSPTCVPISGVTTCNPAGTQFTIAQIVASVDQGMFGHIMGNDPRPTYFHQTNIMSQTTAGPNGDGDGLFYETMNPLLAQYRQYFDATAPIEQPTMAQIGTLLVNQANWATANLAGVTGSIEGNVVTVTNSTHTSVWLPLTGTTGGTPYAGTQSYWVSAPPGTSTYTALAAWPAPPSTPVVVTPPAGPSPVNDGQLPGPPPPPKQPAPVVSVPVSSTIAYVAVQAAPRTVRAKHGKVTVSLSCQATHGRTSKGKICGGKFTLTVAGRKVTHAFRFKSGKVDRITVKLPKLAMSAIAAAVHHKPKPRKLTGKLVITTQVSAESSRNVKGALTITS
jgi:hypothetical protein